MRRSLRVWWQEVEPWYGAAGLAFLVQGTGSVLIPLAVSRVLDRSVASLGVLSSLVSLVGVVGSLTWGRLADAPSRRKSFIVLSYSGLGVCLLGMAFVRTFAQLALLNMTLNFFWMANAAVSVLIVIEYEKQDRWERKIGHMKQLSEIGWVIGLVVGSAAMAAGGLIVDEATAIRGSFLLIGVVGVASAVLAARWIPSGATEAAAKRPFFESLLAHAGALAERVLSVPYRPHGRLNARRALAEMRAARRLRPGTRRFLWATVTAFTGLGLFSIPLPLLLAQQFHMPSSVVFLCFALQNVAIVAAYPLAARRIRRAGNRRVHAGALAGRLVIFTAASLYLALSSAVPSVVVVSLLLAGVGFTWSYFQLSGLALTSRLAKPENRGRALGLYNGVSGVGWILAGVGSGYLAEHVGYQASFGAAAVLLVVALVILRFVPEPPELRGEGAADAGAAP
ncbi:MAG: MFS transporter [Candidatus Bipolaricaulis sp.]|nr:MFS transporter [Candidatus Bipolaricaulis sp.]MDD5220299.1 MFS transporter [Candidatus Bipolaricaulis sp.]